MKKKGPDSLEGLFIALICCLIYSLMLGSAGLSSMLFVACITRYDTDRSKGAFPFILSNVLQAVSGPFAGYFASRFGVRAVVLAGSFLSFLGIGACFLAEDIRTVTVLWGIVFGTGLGLSTLLLPAIINEYFFKQRSKALGLCYLGSPIGFFIFPPVFEVLLDKYGLSGTFLFLAGINMHCIPLSMFLRQPTFKVNDETSPLNCGLNRSSYLSTSDIETPGPEQKQTGCENSDRTFGVNSSRRFSVEFLWTQQTFPNDNRKQYVLALNKKRLAMCFSSSDVLRSFRSSDRSHYRNISKDSSSPKPDVIDCLEREPVGGNGHSSVAFPVAPACVDSSRRYKFAKDENCKEELRHTQNYEEFSTIYIGTSGVMSSSEHDSNFRAGATNRLSRATFVETNNSNRDSCNASVPVLIKYRKIDGFSNCPVDNRDDEKKFAATPSKSPNSQNNSMLRLYLNPVFMLMCLINAIASLHFSTLTTVIIDFSRDLHIDSAYEKLIMMGISLMGGLGMLGFGWVTDGGYMQRTRFASLTQLIGCACTAALPLTVGLETLMVPLAVWCVCQSSFIPLIPAIIAEHFGEDIQAVAVSACNVLSGPLYLIIPPLIGYFRDVKGSYDNIFYLLGTLSFVNSVALFLISYKAR